MKKYQALYLGVKNKIEAGILKAGERLPSIREEALSSAVSVNTVIGAYHLLADEGLIQARDRGGYYVRAGALALTPRGVGEPVSATEKFAAAARETGDRLDRLYERLLHIDPSFATAAPGSDLLPAADLSHAASRIPATWMNYGNPEGDDTLRRRIAVLRQETDGETRPENIIITNGATEAMAVVMRALLRPGDTVALESPTYFNFFRQLAPLKVRIIEIPVGAKGMNLDILEQELDRQKVRMIIAQPNVHNPTGTTMGDEAKKRLAALAERHGTWLVQDDVYGDIYFGAIRPRNLTFFSDYPRILLVSSYSKTVSPGLRVGWLRSVRHTGLFLEEKLRTSMDTCRAAQAILAAFVGTTAHRRHLAAVKSALRSRIEDHILRLSEILPQASAVLRPSGGCLLWITLPPSIDATRVFEKSAGKGLIIAPGALFSASSFFNNHIRLNAGSKLTRERSQALRILGDTARTGLSSADCIKIEQHPLIDQ